MVRGLCGVGGLPTRWGSAAAVAAVMIASAAAPGTASAQSAPPQGLPSAAELDPSSVQPAPRSSGNRDILSAPAPGPCPAEIAGSGLSFVLSGVSLEINGVSAGEAADLEAAYSGLIGQTLQIGELCAIRDRLSAAMFARGVLARVDIPPQTIAGGQVRFAITEARIGSVRLVGDAGPAQRKVEQYVERLRGLTPFDLNVAQRYLLLAGDLPGVDIAATLTPAAIVVDAPEGSPEAAAQEALARRTVNLEIRVAQDPYALVASLQNYGSDPIGPVAGLIRFDASGFTPLAERTTLILYSTVDAQEQRVIQLISEGRFGAEGASARASVSFAQTEPTVEGLSGLAGESVAVQLEARYPWVRSRRYNVNLIGGFDYVDQTSTFASGQALSEDRLRILYLRGEMQRVFQGRFLPEVSAGVELRQGLEMLDSTTLGDALASRVEGDPAATVIRADAEARLRLSGLWTLRTTARAQWAAAPLLAYEELTIGNLTVGRGYDPAAASGDTGLAVQVELGTDPRPVGPFQIGGFAFVDAATLMNDDAGGEDVEVVSVGAGLRIRLNDRWDLDVTYATPLERAFEGQEDVPEPRLLVNLVARFF